jgi:hypothetical protein
MRLTDYSIAFVYSVISAVTGMLLPAFIWTGQFRHPINLLWGSIYGMGWFVAGFFYKINLYKVVLFGSLIWPLIVMLLVTALLGRAFQYYPHRRKQIIGIAIISLLIVVPMRVVPETVLKYLPLYYEIVQTIH